MLLNKKIALKIKRVETNCQEKLKTIEGSDFI